MKSKKVTELTGKLDELAKLEGRAKKTYANDGSYESVEAMLYKNAITYYSRVLALGLPMQFGDVLGIMNVGYVLARKGWSPEKAKFNTYCFTVCRNEFNAQVEKMERERARFGMVSIDEFAPEDGEGDGYEYMATEQGAAACPMTQSLARHERSERINSLSALARRIVMGWVATEEFTPAKRAPGHKGAEGFEKGMSVVDYAAHQGVVGEQWKVVRAEIQKVYGVRLSELPSLAMRAQLRSRHTTAEART